MKEVLLLKCGEIVLKGLNRKTFEDRLLKNLSRRMKHVADCGISMRQSVVYVGAGGGRRGRGHGLRAACIRLRDYLARSRVSGKDARKRDRDRAVLSGAALCAGRDF